ncbi:phytanoyl-CoA dioxygenase family protein [Gayadomonas joobiniege]|uniref:phytanoyl-CoA dioxygenase family protein n=1 Tax=Gayadomonas joobiniege TaxID=1234606 RepID=UPI0003760390|nr:phytanoyl-CoA dioxygenase family protein [Gayadomonas joobiniege]
MHTAQDLYPSRVGQQEKIINRKDPVVYGDQQSESPWSLSPSQLKQFDEDGFLVLPNYLPSLVDSIKNEAQVLKKKLAGRDERVLEPDSGELRSLFALHRHSEFLADVSRDARILTPVEQILASQAYVMQSRLNIKPAFKGKSFAWHSDFETWHVEDGMPRMRAVTAWIMLTENTPYNGPLYVVPGSHKKFVSCEGTTAQDNHKTSLRQQKAGVPKPESLEAMLDDKGIQGIYGPPGTLVLHECNILHGSPDNLSPWPRSIAMFVYNSVKNKVQEPFGGIKPRPEYLSDPDMTPLKKSTKLI